MPTVDQYLVADCLFIIDEFNILYRGYKQDELKRKRTKDLMKWI